MTFSVQSLAEQLAAILPENLAGKTLTVAFSGGLDSTVLLHAAWQLQRQPTSCSFQLKAIHVNHGLSPKAVAWETSCQQICDEMQIPLHIERVRVDLDVGASLESKARQRRYEVFERLLGANECLLMAHHLDDQAETFLMRTLRGAGPRGLSAIPAQRVLGRGVLLRPLLGVSRAQLTEYAVKKGLHWVEDESNHSTTFDRNFCRLNILPVIEQRWPQYRQSWQRSAALSAESELLLNELAALDFVDAQCADGNSLRQTVLVRLSPPRRRNLLRYWFARQRLTEPGWNVVNQITNELISAAEASQPEVRWSDRGAPICVRRYNAEISIHIGSADIVSTDRYQWNLTEPLVLPNNGQLSAWKKTGQGLRLVSAMSLTVRYRQGGERVCLAGRKTRPLKKILQEAELAPWLRQRLPLLYAHDELVCIPGVGVCDGWVAADNEEGWSISWDPHFALWLKGSSATL